MNETRLDEQGQSRRTGRVSMSEIRLDEQASLDK